MVVVTLCSIHAMPCMHVKRGNNSEEEATTRGPRARQITSVPCFGFDVLFARHRLRHCHSCLLAGSASFALFARPTNQPSQRPPTMSDKLCCWFIASVGRRDDDERSLICGTRSSRSSNEDWDSKWAFSLFVCPAGRSVGVFSFVRVVSSVHHRDHHVMM